MYGPSPLITMHTMNGPHVVGAPLGMEPRAMRQSTTTGQWLFHDFEYSRTPWSILVDCGCHATLLRSKPDSDFRDSSPRSHREEI